MGYSPTFTPDFTSFESFYITYPNGISGNTKTVAPGDGNIYQYDETNKTFNIIDTTRDVTTSDQYYIYSSQSSSNAIELMAENGDIKTTGKNQVFNISDPSGSLTIKDNIGNELLVVQKTGATVKVPLFVDQGSTAQFTNSSILIGSDTTSAGARTINFVEQIGTTQTTVSLTSPDTVTLINEPTIVIDGDYFQIQGSADNDGIFRVSSISGNNIIVDTSYHPITPSELSVSATVQKVYFEYINYDNILDNFEFSGDISVPTGQKIGSQDTKDLIQLNTNDITVSKKILVTDTTTSINTISGSIQTLGGIGISKNLNVGGSLTMSGAYALSLTNVDSSISLSGATDSTGTTDGSFHTDGGASIVKNLYVGGKIDIAGNIIVSGSSSDITVQNTRYIKNASGSSIQLNTDDITINKKLIVSGSNNIQLTSGQYIGTSTTPMLIQTNDTSVILTQDLQLTSKDIQFTSGRYIKTSNATTLMQLNDTSIILTQDLQLTSKDIQFTSGRYIKTSNATTLMQLNDTSIILTQDLQLTSKDIQFTSGRYIKTNTNTTLLQLSGTGTTQSGDAGAILKGYFGIYSPDGISGQTTKIFTQQTTNAGPTYLTLYTTGSQENVACSVEILAKISGSFGAYYNLQGLFYDPDASNATQIGNTVSLAAIETNSAMDVDFNTNSNTIRIALIGLPSTTIDWKIIFRYISY